MIAKLGHSTAKEKKAIAALDQALPDFHFTTGVKLKVQIDSIVVSRFGVLVLEFKDHQGVMLPQSQGPWLCNGKPVPEHETDPDPYTQANTGAQVLRKYLEERFDIWPLYIGSLVVLTNTRCTLDLTEVGKDKAEMVCVVSEASRRIPRILQKKTRKREVLSEVDIASVLECLRNETKSGFKFAGVEKTILKKTVQEELNELLGGLESAINFR